MSEHLIFFISIICMVPVMVYGLCSDTSQTYYQIQYHTTDSSTPPSTTHLNVNLAHCISSCEGVVKHDPMTQVCECYNLPHTLTNVALSLSQIWVSGMYLIYILVLCKFCHYFYVTKNTYHQLLFYLLQIQRCFLYVIHHW